MGFLLPCVNPSFQGLEIVPKCIWICNILYLYLNFSNPQYAQLTFSSWWFHSRCFLLLLLLSSSVTGHNFGPFSGLIAGYASWFAALDLGTFINLGCFVYIYIYPSLGWRWTTSWPLINLFWFKIGSASTMYAGSFAVPNHILSCKFWMTLLDNSNCRRLQHVRGDGICQYSKGRDSF